MRRIRVALLVGVVSVGASFIGCSSDSNGPAPSPVAIVAVSGNGQNAQINQTAALPLVVQVNDANGSPVAGASVNWTATGGGTVSAGTSVTNASGKASVTRTVGATMSGYTTTATLPGNSAAFVDFVTLGTAVPSTYSVEVQFLTPVTATQRAAFLDAAARWSSIVVTNFPADTIVADSASCGDNTPPMDSVALTSVLIYATIALIDGPGQILGGASPCWIRIPSQLTLVGDMTFDAADMPTLEAMNLLKPVILHEMGHVLGFGTLWTYVTPSLLTFATTDSTHFNGATAIARYTSAGGLAQYPDTIPVPVENTGGPGTQDGHWRESIMKTELMTGYVAAGANPLSAITIGSLSDLGYSVNYTTADAYAVTAAPPFGAPSIAGAIHMKELAQTGPIRGVDRQGRITRVR